MDLIPIGEAAARLQLSPSALRYYDERGLVCPSARVGGKRMYGVDDMRRLAFIKVITALGVPLDTAAAVLDAPGPQWRETVRAQIDRLEQIIAQARGAQEFLTHALHCRTDHPVRECPTMTGALDRVIAGMSVDQLAVEQSETS